MTVTYNLRNCLRRAYIIAWGSLRVVWFLRGAYASLRAVGFAYAAMPSYAFCLLSILAWGLEPQTTNITLTKAKWTSFHSCQRVSTQSLRGVGQNEPTPMPTQPTPSAWEPAPGA